MLRRILRNSDTLIERRKYPMQLVRSLLIGSLGAALIGVPADAADFFVKPQTAGPVGGTPLASISLQATIDPLLYPDGTDTTAATGGATSDVQFRSAATTEVSTAGKWVKARKKKGRKNNGGSTETSSGTTTGGITAGETSTSGTSTGGTSSGGTSTGGTSTGGTSTGGTTTGGGSTAGGTTWNSFDALMASGQVSGGDRIFLMDGYHGPILIKDMKFNSPVLIAPVSGQTAQVDSILVMNSNNVTFDGLKVWATSANAGSGALIRSYTNTQDINFTGLDVRAVADSGNYMGWSQAEWLANQRVGFQVDGTNISVTKNRLTGLYHGILSLGGNALIEENIVDGFAGDGMRALGDNSIVRRNKVQNCFQINKNHADAFQSFSRGPTGKPGTGTVHNLTIEDNKFFEWVSSTSNPLRCKLQGVGMFDGMFDGVIVRNNLIISRAYHGITIAGALNSQIVNNTVISALGKADRYPWVKVAPHKNGTLSNNVTIANNMATNIKSVTDPTRNILVTDNVIVKSPGAEFTSLSQFDYSLKSTSSGANTGNTKYAPKDDIDGVLRPRGKAPDIGAYESF
jgi:hypothetical protein